MRNKPINHETVRRFCNEKISHFKIPKYVVNVRRFPLTVTGKIKKFELKKWFMETMIKNNKNKTGNNGSTLDSRIVYDETKTKPLSVRQRQNIARKAAVEGC